MATIESAELQTGRRSWDWPRAFLLPLALVATGFFANEFLSFVILKQAFAQHAASEGHAQTVKAVVDMREKHIALASTLAEQISGLRSAQDSTAKMVEKLAQYQREDMASIQKALRIPVTARAPVSARVSSPDPVLFE